MNKRCLILWSIGYVLTMTSQAPAQSLDSEQICPGIQKPGLYYVYVDGGGRITSREVGLGRLHYSVNSRFYYVPRARAAFVDPNNEGGWHIRTQTVASDAPRA